LAVISLFSRFLTQRARGWCCISDEKIDLRNWIYWLRLYITN